MPWSGNPLQYSHQDNPMDQGVWQVTVMGLQRVEHDWTAEHAGTQDAKSLWDCSKYCFKCHPVSSHKSAFSEQIQKTHTHTHTHTHTQFLSIHQNHLSPRFTQSRWNICFMRRIFYKLPTKSGVDHNLWTKDWLLLANKLRSFKVIFKNCFQICWVLIKAWECLVKLGHLYSVLPHSPHMKNTYICPFSTVAYKLHSNCSELPLVFYSGLKSSAFSPVFDNSRCVRTAFQSSSRREKSIADTIAFWSPNHQKRRHLPGFQQGCASHRTFLTPLWELYFPATGKWSASSLYT